jgi:hypothetical protein
MGYEVTDTPSNMNFSTTDVSPVANLTSFVSAAKEYKAFNPDTTIYQQGYSFYVLIPFYLYPPVAVEYTPQYSVWWVW